MTASQVSKVSEMRNTFRTPKFCLLRPASPKNSAAGAAAARAAAARDGSYDCPRDQRLDLSSRQTFSLAKYCDPL